MKGSVLFDVMAMISMNALQMIHPRKATGGSIEGRTRIFVSTYFSKSVINEMCMCRNDAYGIKTHKNLLANHFADPIAK